MSTILNTVTILAGLLTTWIGLWGLAFNGSMSTTELQEMVFWLGLAMFSAGVGLIAAGVTHFRSIFVRKTTD